MLLKQYYCTYYWALYSTSSSGRGMLQAVPGETVTKHQIADVRVISDDGIL